MRAVAESLPLTLRVGDMMAGEVGEEEEEEDRKTGRRGGLGVGEQAKQKQKQRRRTLTPDFLRASQPLDANTTKHPSGL